MSIYPYVIPIVVSAACAGALASVAFQAGPLDEVRHVALACALFTLGLTAGWHGRTLTTILRAKRDGIID